MPPDKEHQKAKEFAEGKNGSGVDNEKRSYN